MHWGDLHTHGQHHEAPAGTCVISHGSISHHHQAGRIPRTWALGMSWRRCQRIHKPSKFCPPPGSVLGKGRPFPPLPSTFITWRIWMPWPPKSFLAWKSLESFVHVPRNNITGKSELAKAIPQDSIHTIRVFKGQRDEFAGHHEHKNHPKACGQQKPLVVHVVKC